MINHASAIRGYDCGTKTMNVTTVSLLDVGDCDIPEESIKTEEAMIQLLQIIDFQKTMVTHCKVEIKRTVKKCGFWGHELVVENGIQEFIKDVDRETCERLTNDGEFRFKDEYTIQDIAPNDTSVKSMDFAGSAEGNTCHGGFYSDRYGTYTNVFVAGTITFKLLQYEATVNMNKNRIHLRSGAVCDLNKGKCVDPIYGNSFWKPFPETGCPNNLYNKYDVIYEGKAIILSDPSINGINDVYTVTSKDITFALTSTSTDNVCGHDIVLLEHPKLVIHIPKKGSLFRKQEKIAENIDMFTYVNSKYVYIERHVRTQMKDLYRNLVKQRCLIEKETIRNNLALAVSSPDEFSYNLLKGPGGMAVVAGEVVHLIKCLPVEVKIEHGEECYTQLQVSWNNETWFLTPKTHILIKRGTLISCNPALPSYYKIDEIWYKILPRPVETISPEIISPITTANWTYKNPASLATSGIYSDSDLDKLRDHINFPMERPALLNTVARNLAGHPTVHKGGSLYHLFDEESLTKLAENTWGKVWQKFMNFGTFSAGIIAIVMIIQFFKILFDTVIRGYTLHSIYGWSLKLMGAIFASITALLIHLGDPPESKPNAEMSEIPFSSKVPTTIVQNASECISYSPLYPNPYPTCTTFQTSEDNQKGTAPDP